MNRNQVIDVLERSCDFHYSDTDQRCYGCYFENGICDEDKIRERVIELLKEQEAKILSWDEIKNYPVVFGEFKGVEGILPLIIKVDIFGRCLSWNPGINVSDEYYLLVDDEEDRKNTRCWNRMPTDEQRQSTKWD